MDETMSWLPGWNSIEGSARWGDVFFWAGFAFLVLLAACILMSKVYGWRKDALVTTREQLISLAEDLRNEELRQLEAAVRERAQAQAQAQPAEREPEAAVAQAPEAPIEGTPQALPERPAAVPKASPAPAPPQREPERIARLQDRSPRALSDAQKKAVIGALSVFRGQKFAVVCIAGDGEGKSLAETLVTALRGAGWEFPESAVAEATYASEPTGVSVMVNAAQALTPALLRPTSNLVKVLADAGLMARTGALADPNVPRDTIEIRVGRNRNPT
jgi:hypothetical protein